MLQYDDAGDLLVYGTGLFTFLIIALFGYICYAFTYFERAKIPTISTPSFPCGDAADVVLQRSSLHLLLLKHHRLLQRNQLRFGGIYLLLEPVVVIVDAELAWSVLNSTPENIDELTISGVDGCSLDVDYKLLITKSHQVEEVDLSDCLAGYFGDLLPRTLLGFDASANFTVLMQQCLKKSNDKNNLRQELLSSVSRNCFYYLLLLMNWIEDDDNFDKIRKIVEDEIKHRTKTDQRKVDLFQNIIDNKNYSLKETIDLASGLFKSSLNIVNTFYFCLHELSINRDIQDELRGEILRFKKEKNKFKFIENLANLSYLDTVVCETFRKYPPVLFVSKRAPTNKAIPIKTNNQVVSIPKNCFISLSIYGLHHSPEHYDNPELFDPDRFSEENRKFIKDFTYLPFGIGNNNMDEFSYTFHMKLALIHFLTKFRVFPGRKSGKIIAFDDTAVKLKPKDGMWLKVEKISG